MKRASFKILFFIKRSRMSLDNKGPVLLRVIVNGFRDETPVSANFMQLAYGKNDIPLEEVNHKFIKDYEFYRNCSHNAATKYLKNFKKITRLAIANDIITKDPFANIKFTLEEVERDFLEDHEPQILINKEITINRLAKLEIFSSFVALADWPFRMLKA